MVNKELLNIKIKRFHPKLEAIIEEPSHFHPQNSIILNDISKLESKHHRQIYSNSNNNNNDNDTANSFDDDEMDIPLESGIDLSRYEVFVDESSGNVDMNKLYTSLAYSINRLDSLKLSLSLINYEKKIWESNNNYDEYLVNNVIKTQIQKKRKAIDSTNAQRKRIQLEKKPLFDYLQNKFTDSINYSLNTTT